MKHRQWTSSLVVTSAPISTWRPTFSPRRRVTSAFKVELWSVRPMMSIPRSFAFATMAEGLISMSPQGESTEWMCMSALKIIRCYPKSA